jgi:REP element-mobilizing transposase RayT
MSRGNRKSSIFVDDDDRRSFLERTEEAARRYRVRFYAACLMDNHYHFVLDTPEGNLSDAMRHINGEYSRQSNRRHGLTGHTFGERFKSLVIQRESYLRRACRYVVLNPVRAKLVRTAADWAWSTYRATAGIEEPPSWLTLDWLELAFDAGTRAEAQERYRAFVNNPVARKSRLDTKQLVVGTAAFKKAVREEAEHKADRILPLAQRTLARPTLETLFLEVKNNQLQRDDRIYDAHVMHGYRLSAIAAFLSLDRTPISKAFQRSDLRRLKARWRSFPE